MKTRSILFIGSLFLAILAPMLPASACSCVPPDPVEFLQTGEFVFVGTLVDREEAPVNQIDDIAYTFSVDRVYVGDIRDATIAVRSAPNGAACGFEVVPGEPVGIVATLVDGALRGGLCGTIGAEELEVAASQLEIEPYAPVETPTTTTTLLAAGQTGDGPAAAAIAAVGVAALVLAAFVAYRRRVDR